MVEGATETALANTRTIVTLPPPRCILRLDAQAASAQPSIAVMLAPKPPPCHRYKIDVEAALPASAIVADSDIVREHSSDLLARRHLLDLRALNPQQLQAIEQSALALRRECDLFANSESALRCSVYPDLLDFTEGACCQSCVVLKRAQCRQIVSNHTRCTFQLLVRVTLSLLQPPLALCLVRRS